MGGYPSCPGSFSHCYCGCGARLRRCRPAHTNGVAHCHFGERIRLRIGGLARLVSGAALVWGASMLLKTWIIRERFSTPLAPALFIISGIFTALSGLCAVVLAATAPDMVAFGAPSPSTEVIASFRWDGREGRLYDGWSGTDCRVALSVEGGRDSEAHCAHIRAPWSSHAAHLAGCLLSPFIRSPACCSSCG